MKNSITYGLIVGNRDFFSDNLAKTGREKMMQFLEKKGYGVVVPSSEDTTMGTIKTWHDAKKCSYIFKENIEKIDGIIVTLPNFGQEKLIANAIRMSDLNVPVLIHAFPDDLNSLDISKRGDSFCGKISVCNNLKQFGIPYSLTQLHTVDLEDKTFQEDLKWFSGVCRIVKGLKNLKIGAIGARPSDFNTVRFSEKILESYGISVETLDLSEVLCKVHILTDQDPEVKLKFDRICLYCDTSLIPKEKLLLMAKLTLCIEKWMDENNILASAIQCWTSMERNLGITPCGVMSYMSDRFLPSACEVDVIGAISMYIMQCASEQPSALVDWNNNYGNNPDKAIIFHCGNFPRTIFEKMTMRYADVIGQTVNQENAYGSCAGNIKPGYFTFARLTSDDLNGTLRAYVGEGEVTKDVANTYGAWGVVHINKLQEMLHFICKNGFEHHVAISLSQIGRILVEALSNYLKIDTYYHVNDD